MVALTSASAIRSVSEIKRMNYTQGSWEVVHEFNVEANGRIVASCGGYASTSHPEETHNENVANARLIAGAPKMLIALSAWRAYSLANAPENRELKRQAIELTDQALAEME